MNYHFLLAAPVGRQPLSGDLLVVGRQSICSVLLGTLPHNHVVNNELPYFMSSKPAVLIPQQVLCPIMECGTCYWTIDMKIAFSIWEQARESHCEKIWSGKLRSRSCVSAWPWDHWLLSSLLGSFCFSFLRFRHNFIYGCFYLCLHIHSWFRKNNSRDC